MTPAQSERLVLLIEECGETIQAATKALRHGYDGRAPHAAEDNRCMLIRELGDLYAVIWMLTEEKDIDISIINDLAYIKLKKLQNPANPYVYYQGKEEPPVIKESPAAIDETIPCNTYGCKNQKIKGNVFCDACAEDYLRDPDAYK